MRKSLFDEMEELGEIDGLIRGFIQKMRGEFNGRYLGEMIGIIIRSLENENN